MEPFLTRCQQAVLEGDVEQAKELARGAIADKRDLVEAIEQGFSLGVREAGKRWEDGLYFLPELAFSAEAMKAAMTVLQPALRDRLDQRASRGVVVIGTVQGDIHDIGKSLVGTMLSANGFEVVDLGADVPHDRFIDQVKQINPDFVCMSALLTTTMGGQRHIIGQLEQAGLRAGVRVLVGGAPTSAAWAEQIGADGYAPSAAGAVELLSSLK